MFTAAVIGLMIAALGFCWPLWRAGKSEPDARGGSAQGGTDAPGAALTQRQAYNAELYRSYEAELALDTSMDADTRAALLADRARQLLDDSAHLSATLADPAATARSMGIGLAGKLLLLGVLLGGSVLVYSRLGTPEAEHLLAARDILHLPALGEEDANAAAHAAQLRELTGGLRAHTRRKPAEAGSWYLLGIGELKLGAYAAAADAFAQAHELVGADANLDLYWLQARLLADEGRLSSATREIAQRVLATEPNQPMVLNMLALAAFRSSEFDTAVGYLNSALSNELTDGQRELLRSGFAQAREALGVDGPTVDIDLQLAEPAPAGAVLFVIARPVGGGMPYAVVRRPGAAVPERVRLDDAVSMNPANPLSAASEVEIVARLSLSGRPQAGPGDWQWQSEPLNLAAQASTGTPIRLAAALNPPKS